MDDFQLLAVKKNTKVWSSLVVHAVAIRPLSLEEDDASENVSATQNHLEGYFCKCPKLSG